MADTKTEMIEALVKLQNELPDIPKDKISRIPGRREYSYCSLEALIKTVRPGLNKHGFFLTQSIGYDDQGGRVMSTTLMYKNGQSVVSDFPISSETKMQEWGSAATYARRYGLQTVLGASPDDDLDASDLEASETHKNGPQRVENHKPSPNLQTAQKAAEALRDKSLQEMKQREAAHKDEWEPGEYVVKFGRNKSMNIRSLPLGELKNTIQWVRTQDKPGKNLLEFVEYATQHIHLVEAKASAKTENIPFPDPNDEIPF